MHDIRGEMYNDSDGKARVSFLFSTKEKDKQGKKGNARIEKKNWNKGREEGAREETPAVVVNQSGNESKGERGGSGGIIVMRGEAGRQRQRGVYRQGEVARNGKRTEQTEGCAQA